MRLKEDKNNWAASNIMRKFAVPPETARHHSNKDTVKWCRGKVGTPHRYGPAVDHGIKLDAYYLSLWVRTCEVCYKREYKNVKPD